MEKQEKILPKKIWFLWLQGYDDMPPLVRSCYQSWEACNPNWELIFLDDKNIEKYIDIKSVLKDRKSKIYRVSQSEIIRINLLKEHGGVWVDATCFCQQPLDQWLTGKLTAGFFAFSQPGPDRMLSSWFMAAKKGNPLVEVFANEINKWWKDNLNIKLWIDKPWIHDLILRSKLHGFLKKRPTLWYHPLFVKVLKIYPYFWFFYFFQKLYEGNEIVKKKWDEMPEISADIPHKVQIQGLFEKLSISLKEDIDNRVDPLYKLTFKFDPKDLKRGCNLDYLLNKRELLA